MYKKENTQITFFFYSCKESLQAPIRRWGKEEEAPMDGFLASLPARGWFSARQNETGWWKANE